MQRMIMIGIASLLLGTGCRNDERAAAAPEVNTGVVRQMRWAPVRNEQAVCQETALRLPEDGPQSRQILCEVVSRAWTAVVANSAALNIVNRDAAGRPRKAYLSFMRMPAATGAEAKFPASVSWQVNFPSAADTVGISVTVDSMTGETFIFADHQFGLPYHDLMNPRIPARTR